MASRLHAPPEPQTMPSCASRVTHRGVAARRGAVGRLTRLCAGWTMELRQGRGRRSGSGSGGGAEERDAIQVKVEL